jgi:hypothetical protein
VREVRREELMDGVHFATKCSFCGTAIVSKSYAGRSVKPRSLVPFQVEARSAQAAFERWLRGRWLAPMDLKRYARNDAALHGVYLPYWTYGLRDGDRLTRASAAGRRTSRRPGRPVSGMSSTSTTT